MSNILVEKVRAIPNLDERVKTMIDKGKKLSAKQMAWIEKIYINYTNDQKLINNLRISDFKTSLQEQFDTRGFLTPNQRLACQKSG